MTTDAAHAPGLFLTRDLPGVGGRLREEPEDFLVEEIPLYEPCGEGEHLYLFVQKRNLATSQAVSILARHFRVSPGAIGHAGLKDKRAVTRQVFSIRLPDVKGKELPDIRDERLHVLWVDRHTNKLRPGHLKGNRFAVTIRGVDATMAPRAKRALDRLACAGAPNFAGEQRFGSRGNNHLLGKFDILGDAPRLLDAMLGPLGDDAPPGVRDYESHLAYARGDFAGALERTPRELKTERAALAALVRGEGAERVVSRIDATQRRFWASAFQSAVFNRVLHGRMLAGSFDRLLEGDLAWKHDNGAVFPVDEREIADPALRERLGALEVSPSGPLWGAKMTRATGVVDALEGAALEETGVTLDALRAHVERTGQAIVGARRALRVPVRDIGVEGGVDDRGGYVRCSFTLPPGAFATVVMGEVMKTAPAGDRGAAGGGAADAAEAALDALTE